MGSLFDIVLSRDMPFCQLQYVEYMHYGFPLVLFCVSVFFCFFSLTSDNARCQFMIVQYSFPMVVLTSLLPVFSIATTEIFLVLFFIQRVEHS